MQGVNIQSIPKDGESLHTRAQDKRQSWPLGPSCLPYHSVWSWLIYLRPQLLLCVQSPKLLVLWSLKNVSISTSNYFMWRGGCLCQFTATVIMKTKGKKMSRAKVHIYHMQKYILSSTEPRTFDLEELTTQEIKACEKPPVLQCQRVAMFPGMDPAVLKVKFSEFLTTVLI